MVLSEAYKVRNKDTFRSLGTVGSLVLCNDCDVCVCLFALIPATNAMSQTVVLVLSWSAYRLEYSISLDSEERKNSARCISAILEPLTPGAAMHIASPTTARRSH